MNPIQCLQLKIIKNDKTLKAGPLAKKANMLQMTKKNK